MRPLTAKSRVATGQIKKEVAVISSNNGHANSPRKTFATRQNYADSADFDGIGAPVRVGWLLAIASDVLWIRDSGRIIIFYVYTEFAERIGLKRAYNRQNYRMLLYPNLPPPTPVTELPDIRSLYDDVSLEKQK